MKALLKAQDTHNSLAEIFTRGDTGRTMESFYRRTGEGVPAQSLDDAWGVLVVTLEGCTERAG